MTAIEIIVYFENSSRKDTPQTNLCSQMPNYAIHTEREMGWWGSETHVENGFWKESNVCNVREEGGYPIKGKKTWCESVYNVNGAVAMRTTVSCQGFGKGEDRF